MFIQQGFFVSSFIFLVLLQCITYITYIVLLRSGWSNFCTLVGHFSKLFEFAGLSRLKIPIFVPKSGCSLKKKKGLHLESVSKIPILAQNHSVLQKKITAAASDRQDLCKIDMRHAAREPVVGPRCYRRLPLLMIDKT